MLCRRLFECRETERVLVSRLSRHQSFDRLNRFDSTSGSVGHAVHRHCGTRKVELASEVPALQQAIDKTGMKDIAGTCGIDYRNSIRGSVAKPLPIPRQDAVRPERGGRKQASVTELNFVQSPFQIALRHQAARKVPAYDEIVDVLDEFFNARIYLVQVCDDWNACGAGPSCRESRRGGVVSIHMQSARVQYPLTIQLFGLED